ncbi:hypothetical protein [Roseisolibacter agri]|uniref:Periplasmic protein n=1 Tax=Roseisolibacter agri TaxID=2014610 RepID=A0AA37QF32_9BACT|nr:hypothetical protein [Roseisolibacter agri]GLC25200.1 hypothetical protein rosag_17130 [Roseisolibacter agri]
MTHQPARTIARAAAAAALLFAVSATSVAAQPPQGGRQVMQQQMLFEGITLTAAQQTKIDSLRTAFREKAMAERAAAGNAGGPPDSATMAARRERTVQERNQLRAVLTADQQATFDKNLVAMEERMKQMRAQRGAGAPPA